MNHPSIYIQKLHNFSSNQELIKQIYELSVPSYINSSALLERDINRCNEVYILRNDIGELLAFFMVNFEKIGTINACFLGWSACHNDYKNAGYAKYLYNSFFLDCKEKESVLNDRILCFWTTATPIAYYWFNKNIDNCQPNLEGDITNEGKENFIKIVNANYSAIGIDEEIPFILRGVATNTNYSKKEKARLHKIEKELNIKAFSRYPINELNGDRYLMLGYAPALEIIQKRLSEIESIIIQNVE
jgi:hypothetical protein